MLDCFTRKIANTSAEQEEKLGRPPFLLGYRTSTPFIALTVGRVSMQIFPDTPWLSPW